jgi:putative Ig domain-containing protein
MRLWSNSSHNPAYSTPEVNAQSYCLSFAGLFTSIGLFSAVVCLIGCNGLAASSRPSISSKANSQLTMTSNLPAGTVQRDHRTTIGQLSGLTPDPTTKSHAPLQIITNTLPDGAMQGIYATALVATGGIPPYSWDATAGQIPPGVTLRSSDGTLSGIPFAAGAFSFTARLQDSTGSSLSTNLSLNISAVPSPTVSEVLPDAASISGGTVAMTSEQSRIR